MLFISIRSASQVQVPKVLKVVEETKRLRYKAGESLQLCWRLCVSTRRTVRSSLGRSRCQVVGVLVRPDCRKASRAAAEVKRAVQCPHLECLPSSNRYRGGRRAAPICYL